MARQVGIGSAAFDRAGCGAVRRGRSGGLGEVGQGGARLGRAGRARHIWARHHSVGCGMAGGIGRGKARLGTDRRGLAGSGTAGMAGCIMVRNVGARFGRWGKALRGLARHGVGRWGGVGTGSGRVSSGGVRLGRYGKARFVQVGCGKARFGRHDCGLVVRGLAWHGIRTYLCRAKEPSKVEDSGNQFLMGGGIPSAKFAIKGASVRGSVIAPPVTRQQSDMVTKELKFFKGGDPMMQVVIRLQTDERDPSIEADDGQRALYIKGASIRKLREAIRRTGAKGLEVGGYLVQTYVSDEMPVGGAPQGAKVYEFQYTRPAVSIEEPSYAPSPGVATAPTTATPMANPLDNLNEEQRAALARLGFKS